MTYNWGMELIDGKSIAAKRLEELKSKVQGLKNKPKLVAVIVGEDPASWMYVNLKSKRAQEAGIEREIISLSVDVERSTIVQSINSLCLNASVSGILTQLPFPKESPLVGHELEILETIDPIKDVDCLTSENLGLIALGKTRYYPATVKGVLIALTEGLAVSGKRLEEPLENTKNWKIMYGMKAVVFGRSDIVGKPTAMALISLGATVTVCNSKTPDLSRVTGDADILVSATGVPGLIKGHMVKSGAIVIDVGINQNSEGKVIGDVEFEGVSKIASAISPVPGGVGPLTVVSLLENTCEALYDRQITHT